MISILLIGIGGFIGAILRYLLSNLIQSGSEGFPMGTLAVNVIGSFLLSLIMYSSEYHGLFREETRIFLTIGLLGAFTTMLTFGYEAIKLMETGDFIMLSKYLFGTVSLTLIAVYVSRSLVMGVLRFK